MTAKSLAKTLSNKHRLSFKENGEYKSLRDFVSRMIDKDINKRAVESLIMCGAFDSFGIKRAQLMAVYEDVISSEGVSRKGNVEGQFSLFDDDAPAEIDFPNIPEFSNMA